MSLSNRRVDRLYGVGDGRTVVLAVDTCKGCISAFEDLLSTGYKSTSFLGTHENPAARGEFRLSPADRLIVVFHRGHHLPPPLLLRRSRSDAAAQHQQLLASLPPLTSPHIPATAQPSPHQASPQRGAAAMFSFLASPRTRSSQQQQQTQQQTQRQWPRSLSGSQQQQQQQTQRHAQWPRSLSGSQQQQHHPHHHHHQQQQQEQQQQQQQVQHLHAPNHWPRSRSEAGPGAAATAAADGSLSPPDFELRTAVSSSHQQSSSAESKVDVETVVVVPALPAKEVTAKLARFHGRTKAAALKMAAMARSYRVRFEAIDLDDLQVSAALDASIASPHSQQPPQQAAGPGARLHQPQQHSWEDAAQAILSFCTRMGADHLLLPASHVCGLNLGAWVSCRGLTTHCVRNSLCPVTRLGSTNRTTEGLRVQVATN
ncbi:hypothetical protein CLOP_g9247 [Closterium sp. NIES-67]|nr:hypothetical protein CLOP_g9247 [Closterium sp. NIES-67]